MMITQIGASTVAVVGGIAVLTAVALRPPVVEVKDLRISSGKVEYVMQVNAPERVSVMYKLAVSAAETGEELAGCGTGGFVDLDPGMISSQFDVPEQCAGASTVTLTVRAVDGHQDAPVSTTISLPTN